MSRICRSNIILKFLPHKYSKPQRLSKGPQQMSLLQLLTDVIEEVYISERSLDPGDIPDRTVFKHMRSLWHLLLGIDENKYDAYNYELLELVFNSDEYKFACYTYLGSDFDNIAETVPHSIGFPRESLKVVELLDDQVTETNTEDKSISSKLSMLNQIRFILFNHHIMVDKLIIDDYVERVLAEYLTADIKNNANESTISFNSNNGILNLSYSKCYAKFVLDDSQLSIDEISREILETFKYEAGVAFFFNYKILIDYHDKMVDILKRVYRKHDLVELEIDDYFKHNPILPIIIPIYRKLTLQPYDETIEKSKTYGKEKIGHILLKQILVDLTTNELKHVLENVPVSLKRFPLVVNYYIESLLSSGIKQIENDYYIQLIESCILKWVNKETDTEIFVTQLCELSTIPTAEPYPYRDTQFPNIHMRMAVFMVRQRIRIFETYFLKWKNRLAQNDELWRFEKYQESSAKEKYYSIWKYKYQKVKVISCVNLYTVETPIMMLYFQKWIRKENLAQKNIAIANKIILRKYYDKIQTLNTVIADTKIRAISFDRITILKRMFRLWVWNKEKRYPKATEQFFTIKKRTIFSFLKKLLAKQKQQVLLANSFYLNTLERQFYFKWKSKAKKSLIFLRNLDHKANLFVVQQKFKRWKHFMHLCQIEMKFKIHVDHELLKRAFSMWYRLKHFLDLEGMFVGKLQKAQCRKFFSEWNRICNLSLKAEIHHRIKTICFAFKRWKLKVKCSSFRRQMVNTTGRNYFYIWTLKATAKQYTESRNYILLSDTFVYWSEKTVSLAQYSIDNSRKAEIIHTSTYFQFWKKLNDKIMNLNFLGEAFLKRKLQNDEIVSKKNVFEKLRTKNRECRKKRLELNRITKSFNEFTQKMLINKWKEKYLKVKEIEEHANFYQKILYETHYYDRWLVQFDRVLQLKNILLSKLDSDSLDLLNKVFSKLQIRMVKIHTDDTKALRFRKRWDRMRLKTFFELWKLKKTNRTSPTPTAKANHQLNDYSHGAIPDLNPYIDLAPRDRGSPEYRGSFRPQFTSILSGQATQFEISAGIGESQTPLISRNIIPSSTYKTPMMRRIASKSNNHISARISPDITENNVTESVKRARQRHIEERLSMYRLLRPPPSTLKQKLSVVSESSSNMFDGGSIFDTPNDSLISSTPIKNNRSQRIDQ